MYLAIYPAIWGGYILLRINNLVELNNYVLMIGLLAGILFSVILLTNRYYFIVTLKRVEFIRKRFLFRNDSLWQEYPTFHKKKTKKQKEGDLPSEDIKVLRLVSTFGLTLLLISIGNIALFNQIDLSSIDACLEEYKTLLSILAFVINLLLLYILAKYLQKETD
jgi:hypothetical protein